MTYNKQIRYSKIEKAQVGQTVFVTATGSEFFKGEVVEYGEFDFYPGQKSYKIRVYRDNEYFFDDIFSTVYERIDTLNS